MIVKVLSVIFIGVEAKVVEIQTHLGNGLPCFNIVGLADKSVNESKERIKAVFSHLKIHLPPKRITINLSPSDLLKDGSHLDLPIALSLLASLNIIPLESTKDIIALGELSLNGDILNSKGILASLVTAVNHKKNLIFPKAQLNEVSIFSERLKLIPITNLRELINYLKGETTITVPKMELKNHTVLKSDILDFSQIYGQITSKNALEIAAAGGHNMLMIGPPGVGKSTLAHAIQGILPPLSKKEMLEVSIIYSIAGLMGEKNLITSRPFRAPHHTISEAGLIGGGKKINPGEITLASKGILFLDELAEFNRKTLDSLREPLETGKVHIVRANGRVTLPCDFQLIAATNPCYCGYFTIPNKECRKAPNCAINYQSKLSGPLLDRIDLIVELSEPEIYSSKPKTMETSASILKKVINAKNIQLERYKKENFYTNAKMNSYYLEQTIKIIKERPLAWNLLNRYANQFNISLRAYNKIIKLTRTISDLQATDTITECHVSEAISYRKANCTNGYLK